MQTCCFSASDMLRVSTFRNNVERMPGCALQLPTVPISHCYKVGQQRVAFVGRPPDTLPQAQPQVTGPRDLVLSLIHI